MFITIWEYEVHKKNQAKFEQLYNQQGAWVKLFNKSDDYIGTELYKKTDGTFMSIDKWRSRTAYDQFYKNEKAEIDRIDATGDGLTINEVRLGQYELI